MTAVALVGLVLVGAALIVWGAETFAEHLAAASVRLGVSAFALALLLAGAATPWPAFLLAASPPGCRGTGSSTGRAACCSSSPMSPSWRV